MEEKSTVKHDFNEHEVNGKKCYYRAFKLLINCMTLPKCLTSAEIFTTTIFSIKLMHDCISLIGVIDLPYRQSNDFLPILTP